MKAKIAISALSLMVLTSFAQVVPNIDFITFPPSGGEREMIDNVPSALDITNNAEYISGYRRNTVTFRDYLLIKYDLNGNIVWQKTFDYAGLNDRALAITVDGTGNIYLTGEATSPTNGTDIITRKYDLNGNLIWSTIPFNGTANGDDKGLGIVVDGSGNVFVCGYTSNTGTGKDYTVIRYNSSGVQTHIYTKNGTANGDDGANAIAFFGNRIYVTGYVKNTVTNNDIFTSRLNTNNLFVNWTIPENGTANLNDQGLDIKIQGNDVLVCGGITNTGTNQDYFFAKYNATAGIAVFTPKTYDAFGGNDFATSLVLDASNTYAITGMAQSGSNSDYHTIKYTNAGVFSWASKHLTNANFPNVFPKIAVDNIANHFYVSGITYRNSIDAAVYQITPGGNESWSDYYDGGMRDAHVDLSVDNFGRIYLATLAEASANVFNVALIRYSQTPVFFPPDLNNEPNNPAYLYYKNVGQVVDDNYNRINDVQFCSELTNPKLFFGGTNISFLFASLDSLPSTTDTVHRIQMDFQGANPKSKIYNFELTSTKASYVYGYLPTAVSSFGYKRLMVPNLYEGIDLHVFSNKQGLKYYYVVKPGAEVNPITQFFDGAISTSLSSGKLTVNSACGKFTLNKPQAYQISTSLATLTLSSQPSWQFVSANTYSLSSFVYNPALPLIIEVNQGDNISSSSANLPFWSTTIPGTADEAGRAVFYDDDNQLAYMAGETQSVSYPLFPAPTFLTKKANYDVLINAFNADGVLDWFTFMGGGEEEFAYDITVATTSNPIAALPGLSQLYVVGSSYTSKTNANPFPVNSLYDLGGNSWFSTGGPVTAGSYPFTSYAYISRFFGNGSNKGLPDWLTYFPTPKSYIQGITVNDLNQVYLVGQTIYTGNAIVNTCVPSFPDWSACNSYPNSYNQTQHNAGPFSGDATDGFIAKFEPNGELKWSTLFGGTGDDYLNEVAWDQKNRQIYVVGTTRSTPNFVNCNSVTTQMSICGSATQYTDNTLGTEDVLIAKFDENGVRKWTTLLGGDAREVGMGAAVNSNGDFYLTGTSFSGSGGATCSTPGIENSNFFPTCASGTEYTQPYYSAPRDHFIVKFDEQNQLLWSTYLGGAADETIYPNNLVYKGSPSISIDKKNDLVYVVGTSYAPQNLTNFAPNMVNTNFDYNSLHTETNISLKTSDVFVNAFDKANKLIWGTFFGGVGYKTLTDGTFNYNVSECGVDISVNNNRVFITGITRSNTNYPVNAPIAASYLQNPSANNPNFADAFIAQFRANAIIGINEYKSNLSNSLIIYPNPTNSTLHIKFENSGKTKLDVYNMVGQNVFAFTGEINSPEFSIDLSHLTSGMYLIKAVNNNKLFSEKVMIYK